MCIRDRTDLDYATGDHHLQMMKAALPYLDIRRQRSLSMFIRAREMMHTMEFFRENDDGMMSVCSLESPNPSVEDMLSAVRPYANKAEQDTTVSYTHLDVYKRQVPILAFTLSMYSCTIAGRAS